MFRYKSNKKACIIAVLVILLCLVCLVGATYALFTSDPDDGTIGIVATSGLVKIDIVDTAGDTLQDRSLAFITKTGQTDSDKIFFEPGATFHTQGFVIENQGNIPVLFNLSISRDEKIDMQKFNEAFDIWLAEENADGTVDIENAEHILNFRGYLQPNKSSKTYYLIIKMKETAGNEFQYKAYTGIGVTVYAVQANGEIEE